MRKAANILWLGIKELRSFGHDFFLVAFVVWSFSFAILSQSKGHLQEVYNASVGIVDEDHSALSRQIGHAFMPPEFKISDIDRRTRCRSFDEHRSIDFRDRHTALL